MDTFRADVKSALEKSTIDANSSNSKTDTSSTTDTTYTVKKGDTLWAIAQKLLGSGNRYPEIKTLNNLNSNSIYISQKLKIPKK